MDALAGLVLIALGLLFLYLVVRKAVHHGILDADETRRDVSAQTAAEADLRSTLSKPDDAT